MNGLTTHDRIEEISKLSGLSEDIIRRVFDAERTSIINSLRRGERATLIGRCVVRPELRTRIEVGGNVRKFIKLHASVAPSMESALTDLSGFEVDDNSDDTDAEALGIMTTQISALL